MTALKGVNLGGWLVLERWMTPETFNGVTARDEYGLVAELGRERAAERLQKHRDNFITEADFKYIAAQGFEFVRLPVGYWLFMETNEFISGKSYVDMAFRWAKACGLGIILDLHGLPGSQNGKMHSGQIGSVGLYQPDNMKAALDTVAHVAARYGYETAFTGLQLANEPSMRFCARRLLQYYEAAYKLSDSLLKPEAKIIVSDAFQPRRMAWELSRGGFGDRLVLDVHIYQLFGKRYQRMDWQEHIDHMTGRQQKILQSISARLPIMVGEWSGVLPRSVKTSPQQTKQYLEIQQEIFSHYAWAWAYWSYKTQGGGAWNARSLLASNTLHVG